MNDYTSENILKIAKRYNNPKRSYLLINPLQAKHLAVNPSKSLEMMNTLGGMLFEKYPYTRLVIGFAETAVAIGAAVASCFEEECNYIQTTRENINSPDFIEFSEEHSHAIEQKIYSSRLEEFISGTPSVIFVDDEISTGKTLVNIINKLSMQFPELNQKEIICASIINRVSDENMKSLGKAGILCEYLLKLPDEDYESKVKNIKVNSAEDFMNPPLQTCEILDITPISDTRRGVNISDYYGECLKMSKEIISKIGDKISGDVLILGTEEFMYPSLILGDYLNKNALCHATTRSPIGICKKTDYPIFEGYKIPSFYDENRETYIYNLKKYNTVLILTDSKNIPQKSICAVVTVLKRHECEKIFILKV